LDFIEKNRAFFLEYREFITPWRKKHQVWRFPNSRQKLEWQAQDAKTLRECVMHLRPSGIRAKKATYLPALVAITQKSVIGSRQRKLSVTEAKRLQGLPDWFDMSGQTDSRSFHQLGNGVSIGAVWLVLQKHLERDREHFARFNPSLLRVLERGSSPDPWLENASVTQSQELDVSVESAWRVVANGSAKLYRKSIFDTWAGDEVETKLSKYDPIKSYLQLCSASAVELTFADIELIIGEKLPPSSRENREWWSNDSSGTHVQASSWLEAGWRVETVDILHYQVRFARW